MREWRLNSEDPFTLILTSDARLCSPDPANDQVWELCPGSGDPPALSLHTSYGLRACSMRIFPRFILDGSIHSNPADFCSPINLHKIHPGFMQLLFSPFPGVSVTAEYWLPESHALLGCCRVANHNKSNISLAVELCAQLVPLQGESLAPMFWQSAHILAGRSENLAPVIFASGGGKPGPGPHPSLVMKMDLEPAGEGSFTWSHAALPRLEESFDLARRTASFPSRAEQARIELTDQAHIYEIQTGDPDWDAAFAFSQNTAFSLLMDTSRQSRSVPFTSCRMPDQLPGPLTTPAATTPAGNLPSPVDLYRLISLIPGAPDLASRVLQRMVELYADVDHSAGRNAWHSAPMLAHLAWSLFQRTKDALVLKEMQPALEAFALGWLDKSHDRDGDGFPEWDTPNQAGMQSLTSHYSWMPGGQDADIRGIETPGLAALLAREFLSLDHIAITLGQPGSKNGWQQEAGRMSRLVEECWSPRKACYLARDRDTHLSPAGRQLGSRRGDGMVCRELHLDQPCRLLIQIDSKDDMGPELAIHLQGCRQDRTIQEVFHRSDFLRGSRLAVATSYQTYTQVSCIQALGLQKDERIKVLVMDLGSMTLDGCLPLLAGIPELDRAGKLVLSLASPAGLGTPCGLRMSRKGSSNSHAAADVINVTWNSLVGEGMLRYGFQQQAARLTVSLMAAVIKNLKERHSFSAAYRSIDGAGMGQRNCLHGLAPLGLFLSTLGVEILNSQRVKLVGSNPFPWPVTVKYKRLTVTRLEKQSLIAFPGGNTVTLQDPSTTVVSDE